MVRAEDASKINRIFERFDLSTVDMASVKSEIERDRAEQSGTDIPAPERDMPEQDKDAFLDELFQPAPNREEGQTQNPTEGRVAKSRQSEPISKRKEPAAQGISDPPERSRSSVRQELDDIKAERQKKAADKGREKSLQQKPARHKAPPKKKPKMGKER